LHHFLLTLKVKARKWEDVGQEKGKKISVAKLLIVIEPSISLLSIVIDARI
jgi:hypothetical protein